jgi:putative transposase
MQSLQSVVRANELGIDAKYQIPDELWKRMQVLLPAPRPKKKLGRPRMDDRKAMNAIFYILRTGCQWNALPRSLGASSTVHDRFQEWGDAGFFERLWKEGLLEYDMKKGIDWEWQSMDGAMTKAPFGGKRPVRIRPTGRNPARR